MPKTKDISVTRLRERLAVTRDGMLKWRYCPSMPKQWNSIWAGREAFTAIDGKGYRHGSLDGTYLRLHRVLWALHYGAWPECHIDHIDGNRRNNAISNMRLVTNAENHRNQKRALNNTSGHSGVGWYAAYSKWRAYIGVNGKPVHLGYFGTLEDAVAARKAAEEKHGYHANHGRT